MIERIVIALIIIVLSVGAYAMGTRWQIARVRHRTDLPLRPGVPAIVYFWSETCAPCKTVQTPALKQLQDELGHDGVQIISIDALRQTEAADAWGVLSVPTTFILDRSGQARRVNHGIARAAQLRQQIEVVS